VKLGSLKAGGRDGSLIVASRDLARAVTVPEIAATMQAALEAWDELAPELRAVYRLLNEGKVADAFELDPAALAAPLPRAYQWLDGSAYLNHATLVRRARGAELPPSLLEDPLMYQGDSSNFMGPRDDILAASEDWGIDMESEVAVITAEVPMGATAAQAREAICLVMLVNDVSLRNLIPAELAKGFGFVQGKGATAFSPVAVSLDELGAAWDGGKVCLPLITHLNDGLLGRPDAGIDMSFDFPTLIAHAAKTRRLAAGTVLGAGTVSNEDAASGSSCLAEVRVIETLEQGAPATPFMAFGDRVRVEMLGADGSSIFGAIEQRVVAYGPPG
jgi:fumarylacetoacetate (FAA) hydrolase